MKKAYCHMTYQILTTPASQKQFLSKVKASCCSEAEREIVDQSEEGILTIGDDGLQQPDFADSEEDLLDVVAAHCAESVRVVVADNLRKARVSGSFSRLGLIAKAVPDAVAPMVRAAQTALRASVSTMLDEFFALNFAGGSETMREDWKDSLSDEAIDQIMKGMRAQERTNLDTDLFKSVRVRASAKEPTKEVTQGSKVEVKGKPGEVISTNATSAMVKFKDGVVQVPKAKLTLTAMTEARHRRQLSAVTPSTAADAVPVLHRAAGRK